MTTESAETHQMIGGMKAGIDHLTTTIQNMQSMWQIQEREAAAGRRVLHEKFGDLKDDVTDKLNTLTNRVNDVDKRLIEIGPAVQEFKDQRQQQKGAMKLGKMLWGSMLAAAGAMAGVIGWGAHWLFSSPPH